MKLSLGWDFNPAFYKNRLALEEISSAIRARSGEASCKANFECFDD
jgi:hypothetical protein